MLVLPITKIWFEKIISEEKKEEYRDLKPYWTKRFMNILAPYWKDFEHGEKFFEEECRAGWYADEPFAVLFRNGYSADAASFEAEVCLRIGTGKPEWGAEEGKEYYVLEIRKIVGISDAG